MEDKDIPNFAPSLWIPMTDPGSIALMGKLGEELGELISVKDRCLIQGIDEAEPTTGKVNRVWLEEEIADVLAMIYHTIDRFGLNAIKISARQYNKYEYKKHWLKALDARSNLSDD